MAVAAIVVSAVILSKKNSRNVNAVAHGRNPGCNGAVLTGFTPIYWTNSVWRREKYTRIISERMQKILITILSLIHAEITKIRHEYEALIKLVITIRFLATGNRYQDLSNSTINTSVSSILLALFDISINIFVCISVFLSFFTAHAC